MLPLGGWRLSGTPLVLAPLTLAALVLEGGTPSAPRPGPRDRVILDDGFESGLGAWAQIPDSGRYTISTDPARIHSGTHSLQALYTPTNGYGTITRWFMPGYDEVFVRFYVMFEEGLQNMRGDGNGMHFFLLAGETIYDTRSPFRKTSNVPPGSAFLYARLAT